MRNSKLIMMKDEFLEEKRYDAWAVRQIINREKCHIYTVSGGILSLDGVCKIETFLNCHVEKRPGDAFR